LSTPTVIRLVAFRPTVHDAVVDAALRAVVSAELRPIEGLVDVFVGRRGPSRDRQRLIVTTWESTEALVAGLGTDNGAGPGELLSLADVGTVDIQVLPITLSVSVPAESTPTILRVFRGTVREGELESVIADAREAMSVAHDRPVALYLSAEPPTEFLAVSAWTTWDAIDAATDGDSSRPTTTRDTDRLTGGSVDHYELLRIEAEDAVGAGALALRQGP
jgi:heme-degrading monooxygenase HmoA